MSMKWLPLNLGTTCRIHANKPANESMICKVPDQIRAMLISFSKAWPETAIKRGGSTVKQRVLPRLVKPRSEGGAVYLTGCNDVVM